MRLAKYLVLIINLIVVTTVNADAPGAANTTPPVSATIEPSAGIGLERVSGEKLATAVGHYARARSLLIAAVNEFDRGYKVANPDAILDSKAWRGTLVDRAEELQKVIDPQPRATRGGIKFNADPRLLNEAGK